MEKKTLAKEIYKISHLKGKFKLRSGLESDEYFDKYLFESNPKILKELASRMNDLIPAGTELVGGLEMGGIPLATAISMINGKGCIFVRKQAKKYGTCKLAEGNNFKDKKVCVIKDVVTTGGQIIESVNELKNRGAVIDTVVCAILRDKKAIDLLKKEGLELRYVFSMEYIKENLG